MAIYGFMATDMTAIAAGNGLDAGQLGASIWPALLVYRSEKRPTRATCRMANQTLWGHFQCRFWGGVLPELSLIPPPLGATSSAIVQFPIKSIPCEGSQFPQPFGYHSRNNYALSVLGNHRDSSLHWCTHSLALIFIHISMCVRVGQCGVIKILRDLQKLRRFSSRIFFLHTLYFQKILKYLC